MVIELNIRFYFAQNLYFYPNLPLIMLRLSLLVLSLVFTLSLHAQSRWSLAFEFQAYPTGLIPGLRADYHFKNHHSVHARAGYNWVRHRDLGIQDDERGDGFGGSLGYRYFFRENTKGGWFLGGRTDLWFNTLDWQDKDENGNIISTGTSKIVVLQPTALGGFQFLLGNKGWFVSPSAAFGVEINVKTEGAEVGEGLILLLGASVGKHF